MHIENPIIPDTNIAWSRLIEKRRQGFGKVNVIYQKNARAISFYQREGFIIQCEGLDEATGEKEYTMLV